MWENGGYFTPKIDPNKDPYCIILPLPNASNPIHVGNALFTIQDILIRYHRMKGDPTLWLPGGDHAGIETQFVFEKLLAKEGKSRFDFDRKSLYQMIWDHTQKYKDVNKDQMKRLGFSLDWTRYHYSLEPEIVEKVFETFRKLNNDGLVYRDNRMVNYCTKCGTAFADLEVDYAEQEGALYYLDYKGIQIATTRPETIFADVALAVNPKDKRYKALVGKAAQIPLTERTIPIIADSAVDPAFGTGALKITPSHDPNDFEIAKRHNLPFIEVINRFGKLTDVAGKFANLNVKQAREAVVKELLGGGFLVKVDENYNHRVGLCYRCGTTIEPRLSSQWYVKTKTLAEKAIKAVKSGETKIFPKKRFEKMYFDWLENINDWNISRQIVWGPRIPAWYCLDCNPAILISLISPDGVRVSGTYNELRDKFSIEAIREGVQSLIASKDALYQLESGACIKCKGNNTIQETDTFDTWFLSGQWPLSTLGFSESADFKYFYPTTVIDTLWDILFFWVARMMMLGIYLAKKPPFKTIHLHARVVDEKGRKMSKRWGNVIDPIEMVEKYGADALRFTLVFGVAPAGDVFVSEDKIRAMRNFANKIWNIGRFIEWQEERLGKSVVEYSQNGAFKLTQPDLKLLKQLKALTGEITKALDNYHFSRASEALYEFIWHTLADKFVEEVKGRSDIETGVSVLKHAYFTCLILLHPFMPYVTEEVWGKLNKDAKVPLIMALWPSI